MGTLIPEASSCKYLGIILRSDLSWADQVIVIIIVIVIPKLWPTCHLHVRFLNMGPRAGIRTGRVK